LLGLFFDPEDIYDILLRNVHCFSKDYMALYPRTAAVRTSDPTKWLTGECLVFPCDFTDIYSEAEEMSRLIEQSLFHVFIGEFTNFLGLFKVHMNVGPESFFTVQVYVQHKVKIFVLKL
jgi:hypothetical protein